MDYFQKEELRLKIAQLRERLRALQSARPKYQKIPEPVYGPNYPAMRSDLKLGQRQRQADLDTAEAWQAAKADRDLEANSLQQEINRLKEQAGWRF